MRCSQRVAAHFPIKTMKPFRTLKEFTPTLRKTFIPYLREDGFKGSMPLFTWTTSPVIQEIRFQGRQGGGGCYVNIDIYLSFPPFLGCIDHRRMRYPSKYMPNDQRWDYTQESAEQMVQSYLTEIRPNLNHFRKFPDSYLLISPEDILQKNLSKLPGSLQYCISSYLPEVYERIYEYIGDPVTAQQFAEVKIQLTQEEDLQREQKRQQLIKKIQRDEL